MPCSSGQWDSGPSWGDLREVKERISSLEEGLCGLCQMFDGQITLHPQLETWYEKHKKQPGCSVGK